MITNNSGLANPGPQEEEYERTFHLIRGDIEAAVNSNHTYLTINNLTVGERDLYEKLNRFPDFWRLNSYCLQTTFFIVFGRLFDTRHWKAFGKTCCGSRCSFVASKIDVAQDPGRIDSLRALAAAKGLPFFEISSVTGLGTDALQYAMAKLSRNLPKRSQGYLRYFMIGPTPALQGLSRSEAQFNQAALTIARAPL